VGVEFGLATKRGRVTGSTGIAGLVAQVAFWAMLAIGVAFGEIGRRGLAVCLVLWACGVFGLPHLSSMAGLFVTPYVAVLDLALVFVVFKGDVRLP
jgi:hypothetical protein